MSKKILSLDLGITSIGYSILEEFKNDRYSLVDYGVSMFDKATDKDGNSKKLLHSASASTTKLYHLRKERKKALSQLFEEFGFGKKKYFLYQEKQNKYKNKWELRAKKAFEEKLKIEELFTILYTLAKHRGYKSLDSDDLLEELCSKLNIIMDEKKAKKADDEKGQIKKALLTIEELRKDSDKTVAQIIYELEMQKENPTFRNHDNYKYMIRREYIDEEIENIILSQVTFGLFSDTFDSDEFIEKLKKIITFQNPSTNDMSLFAPCEYFDEFKSAHQYSIISDIFKMYQSVSNINFNKEKTPITKEQIKLISDDFFMKIKKGKNIPDIKYKDIRKTLKLSDDIKIFNKDDEKLTITKFHFLCSLGKIDNTFIVEALEKKNGYEILKGIFEVLQLSKDPKDIYEQLKEKIDDQTIINLIKNKTGNSLNISAEAMIQFIPYFEDGFTMDKIKGKLNLNRNENYSEFKKGIKYLNIKQFEYDDKLEINNHPVKYVVSATLRVIKHLHTTHGIFDEIRVESTRELSLPTKEQVSKAKKSGKPLSKKQKTRESIDNVNKKNEAKYLAVLNNTVYIDTSNKYNKNIQKYKERLVIYEEQKRRDIYTWKGIELEDIFKDKLEIDHIVPQSLGGLSVKHNKVLCFKSSNAEKSNRLPMNYIKDTESFIKNVKYLYSKGCINGKKLKNLLATNLDETFKDTFQSKSLRATSYIEALTAQILKRYYPFKNEKKQKDGSSVRHIQGRATSNIRKVLKVKTKVRDTNIHHAIDAILVGVTNQSWLQKLSNTFRENMGVIDDKARENIKKDMPLFEMIIDDEVQYLEPKELIEMIEDRYNEFGEDSIFYKDVWGKTKAVNFWVSKKPMVSKIHKDTIYSKKQDGIYTVRENIINQFINLKTTISTTSVKFEESFKKNILNKMYLFKTNPNDVICKVVMKRAEDIKVLLDSFVDIDTKDKELVSQSKQKLDELIHKDIKDNNRNVVRKVKFYQTNLTGFNIRGGLATKEKTFIGFKASLEDEKLHYTRIDVSNFDKIRKENDNSFQVFKNDLVFFIYPDGSFRGGKIVSFLEDKKIASFSNPKFPSASEFQPISFCKIGKDSNNNPKKSGAKQQGINASIGIIKLNLDITGNIKSYQKIGRCESELLEFTKDIKV